MRKKVEALFIRSAIATLSAFSRSAEKVYFLLLSQAISQSSLHSFPSDDQTISPQMPKKVLSVVNERRGIQKISFVAHSLGGLITRYAIGKLYESSNRFSPPVTANGLKEDGNWEDTIAGLEARLTPPWFERS